MCRTSARGEIPPRFRRLIDALASVPRVCATGLYLDYDHHRSVMTLVGEPDAMVEAIFRAIRVATDLIDLRKHGGVHPRVGATDVVPFIPIKGISDAGLCAIG